MNCIYCNSELIQISSELSIYSCKNHTSKVLHYFTVNDNLYYVQIKSDIYFAELYLDKSFKSTIYGLSKSGRVNNKIILSTAETLHITPDNINSKINLMKTFL